MMAWGYWTTYAAPYSKRGGRPLSPPLGVPTPGAPKLRDRSLERDNRERMVAATSAHVIQPQACILSVKFFIDSITVPVREITTLVTDEYSPMDIHIAKYF